MLTVQQKNTNIYNLDVAIENRYLPEAVKDPKFPGVQKIIGYVCEFNKALTEGYGSENDTPGKFRGDSIRITNSRHRPPNAADVPRHMARFAEDVVGMWTGDPVRLHAFALWRLNWIHPFLDGNGRTARQFSYFPVCIKFGKLLPGNLTITSQIQQNKEDHYRALDAADRGDISMLEGQSRLYLVNQLRDALERDRGA